MGKPVLGIIFCMYANFRFQPYWNLIYLYMKSCCIVTF